MTSLENSLKEKNCLIENLEKELNLARKINSEYEKRIEEKKKSEIIREKVY